MKKTVLLEHGVGENALKVSKICKMGASAKSKRAPRKAITAENAEVVGSLEHAFLDVVGPSRCESMEKLKYFVAI